MTGRIERMLSLMCESGFTHALILKPQNMRYLTGYTGEGSLLISASGAVILTDFRYVEQAVTGIRLAERVCSPNMASAPVPALPGVRVTRLVKITPVEDVQQVHLITVDSMDGLYFAVPVSLAQNRVGSI